jgi:hypothetical protein
MGQLHNRGGSGVRDDQCTLTSLAALNAPIDEVVPIGVKSATAPSPANLLTFAAALSVIDVISLAQL